MTTALDWLDSEEARKLIIYTSDDYGNIDEDIIEKLKAGIREHFVPREEFEKLKALAGVAVAELVNDPRYVRPKE